MIDTLSPERRSALMGRVKSKNTGPEIVVRKLVSGLGYRYRLHGAKLPGKPDLVFAKRRLAIFVHGCFWHRHQAKTCRLARMPGSRVAYWTAKLEGNRKRDARNRRALARAGWRTLVVWECQLRDTDRTRARLARFLAERGSAARVRSGQKN